MSNCERCGIEFTKYREHQRFCSATCRLRSSARRNYQREYHTEWRRKNRLKVNENSIKRSDENPEKVLLHHVKSRASKKNIPFNLDVTDISIPETCPILGVPLVKRTRYAPSIDRKNSNLGYVKGNVWIISRIANTMKSNASSEELKRFADWVKQTHQT